MSGISPLPSAQMSRLEAFRIDQPKKGADEKERIREVAKQFEEVLVKQMLKPLEDSFQSSMGTENASPMVGSMVLDAVGQSITKGGGLGFADVIEQALNTRIPNAAEKSENSSR